MRIRLICVVLLMLAIASSADAFHNRQIIGQLVQVSGRFHEVKEKAAFWVMLRDADTGQMQPKMLHLGDKFQAKVFSTGARNFRVEKAWVQFDEGGGTYYPCRIPADILTKRSVSFALTGALSPEDIRCHVKTYTAMPIDRAPTKPMTVQVKAPPKLNEEAQYFTDLAQCVPGAHNLVYGDPYVKRVLPVFVTITGFSNGLCQVTQEASYSDPVDGDSTLEVHCNFSQATLNVLTDKVIADLSTQADSFDRGKKDIYQKLVCQECVATKNGKKVAC